MKKTLQEKLKQADELVGKLANYCPDYWKKEWPERTLRYYLVLGVYQETRRLLNKELEAVRLLKANNPEVIAKNQLLEDKADREYKRAVRENLVTSTTYERAFKRTCKDVESFLIRK